uniref:Uncharacterized protein n=1 Tax=Metapenaeus joyneri majanivirus TaxID=2984280 RepID=A0A9C7BQN8_9VIRU|nr:MAG: hypothetical protein [Metapenaeus joyneri majanivirus]
MKYWLISLLKILIILETHIKTLSAVPAYNNQEYECVKYRILSNMILYCDMPQAITPKFVVIYDFSLRYCDILDFGNFLAKDQGNQSKEYLYWYRIFPCNPDEYENCTFNHTLNNTFWRCTVNRTLIWECESKFWFPQITPAYIEEEGDIRPSCRKDTNCFRLKYHGLKYRGIPPYYDTYIEYKQHELNTTKHHQFKSSLNTNMVIFIMFCFTFFMIYIIYHMSTMGINVLHHYD